jgi:addiction module HigA family antidote
MAEYNITKRPQREPTHPGVILANALIAMDLKVAPAARHLGISRQLLHKILNGSASITPKLAVRIGKLCGNGPDLWANMQTGYDLWHARKALAKEIAKIPTLAEA